MFADQAALGQGLEFAFWGLVCVGSVVLPMIAGFVTVILWVRAGVKVGEHVAGTKAGKKAIREIKDWASR